jgi:hypothetical protein
MNGPSSCWGATSDGQVQRQDFNGRVITIRHDDLKALACILDLGPEQVAAKLDDLGLRYVNRPA